MTTYCDISLIKLLTNTIWRICQYSVLYYFNVFTISKLRQYYYKYKYVILYNIIQISEVSRNK